MLKKCDVTGPLKQAFGEICVWKKKNNAPICIVHNDPPSPTFRKENTVQKKKQRKSLLFVVAAALCEPHGGETAAEG